MRNTIYLYPGYLTKGLLGRMLWHPTQPVFDQQFNDWSNTRAVDVSSCIQDPWPDCAGGPECILVTTTD
jgi:hypothetical protein